MRRSPLVAGVLGAVLALCGMASPVVAESALWTLVASPLTATTGVATTFALTATNEDPLAALDSSREIGCVLVDVPTNFAVHSAAVTGASTGGSWGASVSANRIRVRAGSGGDRLELLDSVRFTIGATALSAGSLAWGVRAYRDQDCGGSGALVSVPPVVVVTDGTVTPTLEPVPTLPPIPTPTPTSTPTPTPKPTRTVSPSSAPSASPVPSASSTAAPPSDGRADGGASDAPTPEASAGAAEEPAASSAATASSSASASPTETEPAPGEASPSDRSGRGTELVSAARYSDGDGGAPAPIPVELGALGWMGSVDVWIVPGLLLGVPGLLVVVFVLLQTAGAAAWIPAIRRLGSGEGGGAATA